MLELKFKRAMFQSSESPRPVRLRKLGQVLLVLSIFGFVSWLLASPSPSRIFGLYSGRQFLILIILTYVLGWTSQFCVSRQPFRQKLIGFLLTSVTIILLLACLEIPAALGFVDYRRVITPSESFMATNMKPWDNTANILDRDLIHVHPSGHTIKGETNGDLVRLLGLQTNQRYVVDLKFDSHGFRNATEMNEAAIVTLGDSFLEGILLPHDKLISSALKQKLAKEVSNLGQSGYGPQQELAVLRRFGIPLKPKVVIWLFFEGNDLIDVARYERFRREWHQINRERNSFGKRSFIQNALLAINGLTAPGSEYAKNANRSSCKIRDKNNAEHTLYCVYENRKLSKEDQANVEIATSCLSEAREICESAGVKFLLVYVPTKFRVYEDVCSFPDDGYGKGWPTNDLPSYMRSWSEKQGIPYLDLTSALKQEAAAGELVYFTDDGHWNEKGHAIAARVIANFIQQQKWLATP